MTQLTQTGSRISASEQCARRNDDCRWLRGPRSNYRHMITIGAQDLITGDNGAATILRQAQLQAAIRNYNFKDDDGELLGAFEFAGQKLFFKIDAYDRELEYGSLDPADASVTIRVMTVMLAREY